MLGRARKAAPGDAGTPVQRCREPKTPSGTKNRLAATLAAEVRRHRKPGAPSANQQGKFRPELDKGDRGNVSKGVSSVLGGRKMGFYGK